MPETTENYHRIPNPKHEGCNSKNLRTITISSAKGIKALYCIDHKKIKTYLFDIEKWTMSEAKKWVSENAKVSGIQFAKSYVEKREEKEEDGMLGLCVISSGTVDRQGDVLDPEGWSFRNFKKNPVLLWSHNSGMGEKRPPIGKVEDVYIKDGKVYFVPKFDLKDPFAKEIYRKYKEGYLNAFSVGFLPLEWEETETGYYFKKQEALEFSAVNVPANPEALVVLRDSGFEVSKDWKEWRKDDDDDDEDGGLAGENPQAEEDEDEGKWKGVIGYKKHPLAPEDTSWNGPKEVAQADVKDLKVMCAWYDSENPDVKSSYKLPHHRASDKYTVWNGVRAAMAALFGARGGVKIPESDWNGVYNHLAKHYRDFGKEPPEKKHFEMAIWKVSAGKDLKKKKKSSKNKSEYKLLVRLLSELLEERR